MDWSHIIAWDKQLLLALNGSDSLVLDQFMYLATKTWVWLPFFFSLLYTVVKSNSAYKTLLLLVFIGVLFGVSEGVSSGICKPLFARFRPTHDPEIMGLVQTVNGYRGGLYGFFSSHAANTFSLAVFLACVVRSWSFGAVMFAWAALHTYTRIYLGVHFPGDILVGVCFGLLWGTSLYLIYRNMSRRLFHQHAYVSENCTSSGYLHASVDISTLTFLMSVFLILVGSFFTY